MAERTRRKGNGPVPGPFEATCEVPGDIAINNAKGALFGFKWQFSPNWLIGGEVGWETGGIQ